MELGYISLHLYPPWVLRALHLVGLYAGLFAPLLALVSTIEGLWVRDIQRATPTPRLCVTLAGAALLGSLPSLIWLARWYRTTFPTLPLAERTQFAPQVRLDACIFAAPVVFAGGGLLLWLGLLRALTWHLDRRGLERRMRW